MQEEEEDTESYEPESQRGSRGGIRIHYYDAENIRNNENLEEEENNHHNEEETGDEVDERLIDRLLDHQNREENPTQEEEEEFSSVPSINQEEREEESQEAPCNETEDSYTTQSQVESRNNAQDRQEIERVFSENGEIPPVEATFEKPTQSVKKNVG